MDRLSGDIKEGEQEIKKINKLKLKVESILVSHLTELKEIKAFWK